MPELDSTQIDSAIEDLPQQPGVADLLELYRRVEETYVAAQATPQPALSFLTDSTNALPPRQG